MNELLGEQRAVDLAHAAERRDATLDLFGGWARSVMPPVGWGVVIVSFLAIAAILAFRRNNAPKPDWARWFFGVKRKLHARSELRPKASRYSVTVPAHERLR